MRYLLALMLAGCSSFSQIPEHRCQTIQLENMVVIPRHCFQEDMEECNNYLDGCVFTVDSTNENYPIYTGELSPGDLIEIKGQEGEITDIIEGGLFYFDGINLQSGNSALQRGDSGSQINIITDERIFLLGYLSGYDTNYKEFIGYRVSSLLEE